jgi:hypothetical protein
VKKIISLYILNTQPQNPGPATAAKEGVHPADGTGEIYILEASSALHFHKEFLPEARREIFKKKWLEGKP